MSTTDGPQHHVAPFLLCGFSIGQANLVLFTSFELSGKYSGITHSVILLHIEPINVHSPTSEHLQSHKYFLFFL